MARQCVRAGLPAEEELYGMFKKPSQEDMIRIGKRINIYDGEYAENEMMKLRRIGVPKIRE